MIINTMNMQSPSLVNQPYFGGRNTSGHTRTALLAGRNVGLCNARYDLTTSMQSTQSICISLTCSSNRRQRWTNLVQKKRVDKPNVVAIGSTHKTCQALYVYYAQCIACLLLGSVLGLATTAMGYGHWAIGL